MKRFSVHSACVLMLLGLFLLSSLKVAADLGDVWALPSSTAGTSSWRVNSSYNLLPGTTNVYDIGSSSAKVKAIYATDIDVTTFTYSTDAVTTTALTGTDLTYTTLKGVPVTVTANATLATDANLVYIGSISGNRTYVLPTPSAGRVITIQDTIGNVSVNGNVTIDGASTHTINGALNVTMEEAFGGLHLVGVSSTSWAASKMVRPDAE